MAKQRYNNDPRVEHIQMNDTGLVCTHCKEQTTTPTPMGITELLKTYRAFRRTHRTCPVPVK